MIGLTRKAKPCRRCLKNNGPCGRCKGPKLPAPPEASNTAAAAAAADMAFADENVEFVGNAKRFLGADVRLISDGVAVVDGDQRWVVVDVVQQRCDQSLVAAARQHGLIVENERGARMMVDHVSWPVAALTFPDTADDIRRAFRGGREDPFDRAASLRVRGFGAFADVWLKKNRALRRTRQETLDDLIGREMPDSEFRDGWIAGLQQFRTKPDADESKRMMDVCIRTRLETNGTDRRNEGVLAAVIAGSKALQFTNKGT